MTYYGARFISSLASFSFVTFCNSMAKSIWAMVPKLDALISILSTADKELSFSQAKLYD